MNVLLREPTVSSTALPNLRVGFRAVVFTYEKWGASTQTIYFNILHVGGLHFFPAYHTFLQCLGLLREKKVRYYHKSFVDIVYIVDIVKYCTPNTGKVWVGVWALHFSSINTEDPEGHMKQMRSQMRTHHLVGYSLLQNWTFCFWSQLTNVLATVFHMIW